MVHNRSRVVNGATHAQFKKLPEWISQHALELYPLLEPGRILFGEWLYARHSRAYSRLPDYFLAFDIFDGTSGQFLSRRARNELLAPSGIAAVPLIFEGPLRRSDLPPLLDTRSRFASEPVEGLYLRVDEGASLKARAKLVRPDFMQNITTHWSSHSLIRNGLAQWGRVRGED